MTMHTFEFENLLAVIDEARRCIPPQTQIVVNIGDFEPGPGPRVEVRRGAWSVPCVPSAGRDRHEPFADAAP